jgi:hypothetical protein
MRKRVNLFLLFFGMLVTASADAQNLATTIKVQAMDMATAWIKNDFAGFVKYMHPAVITFAGGNEKMKVNMDSAYAAMKRFSVKVKRYWIGSPGEIAQYKNQLQAVLPVSTTLEMVLGEMTVENSMIAISDDGGKNWTFIDTNIYNLERLQNISFTISPDLVIPPHKKPKIVPVKNTQ